MPHAKLPAPIQAFAAESSQLPPGAIYSHGNLTGQVFADGTCDELLTIADWMCDADREPGIGVLALLADSVTGWSASTRLPATSTVVTAQLRIEIYRMPRREERRLAGSARVTHLDDDVGFVHADLRTVEREPIGSATMRAAVVPNPIVDRIGHSAATPMRGGPIGRLLGTRVSEVSDGLCVCEVRSARELANLSGQLHGGAVVMAAERAIVELLERSDDPPTLRPLDIDVGYLRPLDADDSTVTVRAELASRTRRFLQVSASVHRPDGRVAATVRATYARLT
jgi:uncharacterized protein (TIGR00369 family)